MKTVGISGNRKFLDGFNRDYVLDHYSRSIVKAGGVPLILPLTDKKDVVRAYIDKLDALILTGGEDVDPFLYNEEVLKETEEPFQNRDEFDYMLIEEALKKEIPILGICRGMQILNVYMGGTLYQDLRYYKETSIKHAQESRYHIPVHSVDIKEKTYLYELLGRTQRVNSVHHQAVKELGEGLELNAVSKSDGVIEGFESKDRKILGIQWHPEMMFADGDDSMKSLFEFLLG